MCLIWSIIHQTNVKQTSLGLGSMSRYFAHILICIPKGYTYQKLMAMLVNCMIWYCYCFLSGFRCTFGCIVQYSLYHMDIGTMWHCTLVSSTPSQSTGLFFGCALVWCWMSLGAHFIISLIEFYFAMIFIMIVVMAIYYVLDYTLGIIYVSSSGSANAQPLDVSAPGHSPWILDWTYNLWTPLCHVYIPY